MDELWTRLEAWALNNAGKSLGLRPGATEEAIAAAEQAMGLTFPADYRASLLAHDGQEGRHGEVFEWLPGCSPLKPLAQVVERYKEEQGLAEEFPDEEQRAEGPLHTVLWPAGMVAGSRDHTRQRPARSQRAASATALSGPALIADH